jgi:8-oxo-dGTP pyrophosphatase MutT (NUDIX family)
MSPAEEPVLIVDRDNREIGVVPRREMRGRGLVHRSTYILVFNSGGEVYVQKRTLTKDVYPGYYDVATGGVVQAGESYEESAERELAEELGVRGVPLAFLFDFYFEENQCRVWGRAFSCVYDGELTLQAEEVESGEFLAPEEILRRADLQSYTPDGLEVLRRYCSEWLR